MTRLYTCLVLSLSCLGLAEEEDLMPYTVTRLNDGKPIISAAMFEALGAKEREGENINGPCVIRLPEWLKAEDRAHPDANYYLYFGHHGGLYIRMAWAAYIEGPWTLYRVGDGVKPGSRGVLDFVNKKNVLKLGHGVEMSRHLASPDVILDHENQEFRLLFHAPTNLKGPKDLPGFRVAMGQTKDDQRTFSATSRDGLNFNRLEDGGQEGHRILPVSLGISYFRTFEAHGRLHAFSNRAVMYRPPVGADPYVPGDGFDFSEDYWEKEPAPEMLFKWLRQATGGAEPRHAGSIPREDGMRVFFTQVYGEPERILAVDVKFNGSSDWKKWTIEQEKPFEILRPELAWEGVEQQVIRSENGPARQLDHSMRDPFPFQDKGKLYLFYAGGGEQGIGLVLLEERGEDSP